MINFFQIPIALFYLFLYVIYFLKVENKILKLITLIFGIYGLGFLIRIIYPNDILIFIVFICGFLASILLFIYAIKGNKIILLLFIIPFLLGYVSKGLHLPFVALTAFVKIFSLGIWGYLTVVNLKNRNDEKDQELCVLNLFAIELILGLIGMLNFAYKTWG